jgi:Mce-associated membrane protein
MKSLLARHRATGESATGGNAAGEMVGPGESGRPDRIDLGTRAATVVAVIGLVGVLVFGTLYGLARFGPGVNTANGRDDALVAARQIAVNLQTLDYATVDKGLDIWQSSATGPLLAEIQKNRLQYSDQLRKVQTTSTASVVDAALSDLDLGAGTATALAAVDVKTTQSVNGTPSLPVTRQVRIKLELVRVPDAGWKAAAASAIQS